MLEYVSTDTPTGTAFLIGTDSKPLAERIKQASTPAADTPTPTDGDADDGDGDRGGPITRFTNEFSPLGLATLEHIGLSGHEIADAVQTRVQELFRNDFPTLKPRFASKCEDCGTEYHMQVDYCQQVGCSGETRPPDPAQKRAGETLLESVNKEGQSLRDIAKAAEFDQWFTGVPVLVLRHSYKIATASTAAGEPGEILHSEPEELVKGDPKRIVPVVDENRRIGGYWWACPRCRSEDGYDPAGEPGHCEECGAKLKEVYFAEGEYWRGRSGDAYDTFYFREEILTYPYAYPRLHGLDGLSPVHHGWLKQLIIEFQDNYAAAFYDPDSDRLPNQFMILHTTNADKWEDQLQSARKNAKEDKYDSPIFANEYSPQDQSTPEVQVVDAMPDELLGQNQDLKQTFKKDIRQIVNVSDIYDSDMSEAGGLNNEGLQIEVTNRSIADQMHDYTEGWLDTLAKRLGIEDYKIGFLESTGPEADELRAEVEAGIRADEAGLDARFEGDEVEIADGEIDVQRADPAVGTGGSAGGGGPGMPTPGSDVAQSADNSNHDYGPDAGQKARDIGTAIETLEKAHKHLVWPDLAEQKASEPFFDRDEEMPEFVKEAIRKAIDRGAISTVSEKLPDRVSVREVRQFFREKLTQPQGWSLESLSKDYADRFDVDPDDAEQAVRTQTSSTLNKGREIGYREQGEIDERLFKWVGPIDDRKTDASWEVLEKTNPDHGGEPRPLDELKEIVAEARGRHFPNLTGAEWMDGWQDRDTYVEHFED